jgi:hypothetical protein
MSESETRAAGPTTTRYALPPEQVASQISHRPCQRSEAILLVTTPGFHAKGPDGSRLAELFVGSPAGV